ncbi:MAG: hypothetical protein ACFE0I_23760 [Elainellaceae cyanobacterium]
MLTPYPNFEACVAPRHASRAPPSIHSLVNLSGMDVQATANRPPAEELTINP